MPTAPMVALLVSLVGCYRPADPQDSVRPTPPTPSPTAPGPSGDECYGVGWDDCEADYSYDPAYWGCVGNGLDASYDAGYCDCEEYYEDHFYCG